MLILHLAAVQLCIHLGTALGHSRGHVHIVLMRALQTQLTEETWESELRLECPHKHYVNMTPAVAECRARMYAELHGGKV